MKITLSQPPMKQISPIMKAERTFASQKTLSTPALISFKAEKSSKPLKLTLATMATASLLTIVPADHAKAVASPARPKGSLAGSSAEVTCPQPAPGNPTQRVANPLNACFTEKTAYVVNENTLNAIDALFRENPDQQVANIFIPRQTDTLFEYNKNAISVIKKGTPTLTGDPISPDKILYEVRIYNAQKEKGMERPEIRFVTAEINENGQIWNSKSNIEISSQQVEDLVTESLKEVRKDYDVSLMAPQQQEYPHFRFGGNGNNPWKVFGDSAGAIVTAFAAGVGLSIKSFLGIEDTDGKTIGQIFAESLGKAVGRTVIDKGKSLTGNLGYVLTEATAAVKKDQPKRSANNIYFLNHYYRDYYPQFDRFSREHNAPFKPSLENVPSLQESDVFKDNTPTLQPSAKDFLEKNLLAKSGTLRKKFNQTFLYSKIEPDNEPYKPYDAMIARNKEIHRTPSSDSPTYTAIIAKKDTKFASEKLFTYTINGNGDIAKIEVDGKMTYPQYENAPPQEETLLLNRMLEYIKQAAEDPNPDTLKSA